MSDGDPAARPQHRRSTAEYELAVLAEHEPAEEGLTGSVLRREGLYSSQITEWRQASDAGALGALEARTRQAKRHPAEIELEKLRRRHARTEAEPAGTRTALDIVGKASALLELSPESADTDKKSTT